MHLENCICPKEISGQNFSQWRVLSQQTYASLLQIAAFKFEQRHLANYSKRNCLSAVECLQHKPTIIDREI